MLEPESLHSYPSSLVSSSVTLGKSSTFSPCHFPTVISNKILERKINPWALSLQRMEKLGRLGPLLQPQLRVDGACRGTEADFLDPWEEEGLGKS